MSEIYKSPAPAAIDRSIGYILSRGLSPPSGAWQTTMEMLRALGPRRVFWDAAHSLIFAAVTATAIAALLAFVPPGYQNAAAVGFAPTLFLAIALFAETGERAGPLYELKQTCRYAIRQIAALRTLCHAALGIVPAALFAALSADTAPRFAALLPLCLLSLFVCASLELSAMRLFKNKYVFVIFSIIWIIINLSLPLALKQRWEIFLSGVPMAISIILALAAFALFARQLSIMIKEVPAHAFA